ncbi:hypothetical protein EXW96_18255 [Paenibacillus sp. JMULE4]|nr:hypothetical protein [Paenibacillus sp. JMULE4]NTZ19439.1 hypothetical protein [Paenibacillus sp. JMULE4]
MIYLQQMLKWQQFDLNSKLIEEKAPAFLKYGTFLFPGRLVLEVFAQRLNWEQFLMLLGIYWMADQQNEHMFSIDYPIIISLMEKELGPCKKLIKELNHLGYFQLECKQKEHLIRLPHLVEEFLDYEPTI